MRPVTGWPGRPRRHSNVLAQYLTMTQLIQGPVLNAGDGVSLTDFQLLIGDLGGDAAVPAFYDSRFNVAVTGANVTSWADVRGAGFGPTLTTSATNPTRTAGPPPTITLADGVTKVLASPSSALFDFSKAISVAFIGDYSAGNGFVGIADDVGTNVGEMLNVGGAIGAQFGGTQIASLVARSATPRCVLFGKDAAATSNLKIQVATQAAVTGTVANLPAGNEFLVLGNFTIVATSAFTGDIGAVLVLNRLFTSGDVTKINTWALANHGTVNA